ncbi:ABC transporter [Lachnellula occidentalis]|uniref:ABC transporter n=1 Tax=Lachnellula occidentalis TaxID=215460 RepID=A0A8H8S857_9HELO|nr:ABC transporter [Lachnellula occidentalis]
MNQTKMNTCLDDSFGPIVSRGCRDYFDFTLLFEQSILSIGPSILFILAAVRRTYYLWTKPRRVSGTGFKNTKLVFIIIYGIMQVALLVLICIHNAEKTRTAIPSIALYNIVVVFLCMLSFLEHTKSIRPSAILNFYLLFTLVFDGVQLRTIWLIGYHNIAIIFTTASFLKLSILLLEATEKGRYLGHEDQKLSPEQKGGIFNTSLFWWLSGLLAQGRRKILNIGDLYSLNEELSATVLLPKFLAAWKTVGARKGSYRAISATFWALIRPFAAAVIPRLCLVGFKFCQPLLIKRLIIDLQQPVTNNTSNQSYGLIGAYGIVYLGIAISTGIYYRLTYRCLTMIRGVLVSAIYHKTTQTRIAAFDDAAAVTLMSSDTERIIFALRMMHEVWANVLEAGLATWLLYTEVGLAFMAPMADNFDRDLFTVSGTASVCLSFRANIHQREWMAVIQKRVATTAATFSAIKGVKMLGLSQTLSSIIQTLRMVELQSAKRFRDVVVWTAFFAFAPLMISPIITYAFFVYVENHDSSTFDASTIYTSISALLLITQPLSTLFQAIPQLASAVSSFGRISLYLSTDSLNDNREILNTKVQTGTDESLTAEDRNTPLEKTSIDINTSSASALASTTSANGVSVPLDITIQDGSFGWNENSYVLNDLNLSIPGSQMTMIIGPVASGKSTLCSAILGEIPFSKGRIQLPSLEMAFCDQTPFLVNATLRQNVLGSLPFESLWYDTVVDAVWLKDDLARLPSGDQTLLGTDGLGLSGGQKQRVAMARAVYSRKNIAIFDDVFNGFDATTKQRVFTRVFGGGGLLRQREATVLLFTHDMEFLPSADHVIVLGPSGTVIKQGPPESLMGTRLAFDGMEMLPETSNPVNGTPELAAGPQEQTTATSLSDNNLNNSDISVYSYYFASIGTWSMVLYFVLAGSFAFFYNFPLVWLSWWSDAGPGKNGMYLGVYSLLQILCLVSISLLAKHAYTSMATKSGKNLHQNLLRTALSAPLIVFHQTEAGSMTNRFSQDILLIDTELPNSLMNLASFTLISFGQAIVIAVASPYLAISFPIIVGAIYMIQKFYLRTSRQLRSLELEAKSPLYTHFLETLRGLRTIRAFGWTITNKRLNSQLLDTSQRPLYLLFMVQRWLTLVLDLMITAIVLVLVGIAVGTRSKSGYIGVALVNLMSFNDTLKNVVLFWTTLETSIGSVSRIKDFSESTKSENLPQEIMVPSEDWPRHGRVQFVDASASYNDEHKNPAFKNISLTINPGEKIAICGKSGSGKSSLILALFRMIELHQGTILIDGIDVTMVPRETTRSRLNAIPQETFFLRGTFRENLDPSGIAEEASLVQALKRVNLESIIPITGSIDSDMDPEVLSHGQRQLFSLARAILRPAKIVVLDEATSSVDQETDDLMQGIIREVFEDCTLIAVAHRLNTIMDFDRVAVFEGGELMEYDSLANLLAQPSLFRSLYNDQQIRH